MGSSLAGIAPELALVATVLVLIVADVLLRHHPARRSGLLIVALAGLAAAAAAIGILPPERGLLFSGMVALDGFAIFFKALFLAAALLALLFGAISPEIPRARYGEYLILILCLTLGMSLLAAARNLLMIYLAIEMVSLPSYILTGFRRSDRPASEAALKYVIYGAASSGLMLYGFSLLYGFAGSLDLATVGRAIASAAAGGYSAALLGILLAALFSLVGFGYKIAAVPFHMWCPDVYEGAPTPFVAFLSAGPKAAGFAALLRFLLAGFGQSHAAFTQPIPWPAIIGALAVATMTLGNLSAIHQQNVKRLLAYSSIAHAGYMLMAVAVGSEPAVRAVLLYLPIYLFMNMGAFLAVMAARAYSGAENLSAFRGLGRTSPLLALLLTVFLFSLTGLPPLAGFIGKFYLFSALLRTGATFFYSIALIGVLNSVVSLYYYLRIVRTMYFEAAEPQLFARPLPAPSAALLTLCAIPTVLLGVWWGPLAAFVDRAILFLR